MSYNVKTTAGNTLVVVPDRSIDQATTSLALVGFNATDYGLHHAENFVHLLEHFASDVSPPNPMTGQLWFDTGSNAMKVYHEGKWGTVSGTPSTGGDPNEGGISGVFHCPIASQNTSVALLFAGGSIVAVIASKDIPQSALPQSVAIDGLDYTFQNKFAFGLQGGLTLADGNDENNADDYVIAGRVPLAEQAHFAGGGVDDAEVSGWGYIDMGAGKSVGLMISNGQIIAAVSSAIIKSVDLPTSISFYVKKDRDTGTGSANFTGEYKGLDANYNKVTCQLKARFPAQVYKEWGTDANGIPVVVSETPDVSLFPGITFAMQVNSNGAVNQAINSLYAKLTSAYGTAIASASDELKVWVDERSATAQKVTSLVATFTTATGTTSVAEAVQSLIARATDTSATSTAITSLKAEFQSALGTSSFGEALQKLTTTANATGANSQAITSIQSTFTDKFGGQNFAEAINNLFTKTSDDGGAVAGWGLSLNSNGYITGIEALNGGASNNYFKVTSSNFIIGDNNIDFIPFQVKDGKVYMKNAVIENLTLTGEKIAGGLSGAFKFTAPDTYVSQRYVEQTIIETPPFSIGDNLTEGQAVAFICFYQDGRYARDNGQDVRVYVNTGGGYVLQRYHQQQGFRVKGGDITFAIPVMFPITFSSTQQCQIKVTSTMIMMPGQDSPGNPSYCRNTEIHVFRMAR